MIFVKTAMKDMISTLKYFDRNQVPKQNLLINPSQDPVDQSGNCDNTDP